MTLRCEISIVPFGDEENKQLIRRFDISNVGQVDNLGFGHAICAYWVKVYERSRDPIGEGMYRVQTREESQWPLMETHDRRDGAEELIRKVLQQYEDKSHDRYVPG